MLHLSNDVWLGHGKYQMPRENLLMIIIYLKCLATFVEGIVRKLFTLPWLFLSLYFPSSHPFLLTSSPQAICFSLLFFPFLPFPPVPFPISYSPIVSTEIFLRLRNISHIKNTVNHIADIIYH